MTHVFESQLFAEQGRELAALSKKKAALSANRRAGIVSQRMYQTARNSRLTSGWTTADSSADAELISSIRLIRSRSRALIRDSSYAKRAQVIVVNNVIGTGIGMQAQVMTSRDKHNDRVNDEIESVWCEWSDSESCHTGGRLGFKQLERVLMAQIFAAGEVFVRKHYRAFGNSKVPFALEVIEAERIADDLTMSVQNDRNATIRLGVEVDEFFRPVAYFFRKFHREDLRFTMGGPDQIERVPADQIIHLAPIDRWPQTRGEPWLHTAATRLNDMDAYSEAEILRARSQAVRMGIIESGDDASSFGEVLDDGSVEMEMEPNVIQRLNPGEKWVESSPNAPNPNMDPFMRYMVREICAGVGPSYESVSRDYSQSNYSSSRLALLDDRDLWRYQQSWFIADFRKKVHREWLRAAVLAGALPSIPALQYGLDAQKFEAVLFKPRGWSWIDPTKEVAAYKEAIMAGLTTRTDVISQTGGGQDIEDIDKTRERELREAKERGLVFDTDPDAYMADAEKAKAEAKHAKNSNEGGQDPPPADAEEDDSSAPPRAGRAVLEVVK